MEDLEKETRRWWFSPRSWLWNSMRDSMASSTEPIWIRAILWSFLEEKPTGCYQTQYGKGKSFATRDESVAPLGVGGYFCSLAGNGRRNNAETTSV